MQIKYWVVDPHKIITEHNAEGQETRISFFHSDIIVTAVLDEDEIFDPPPPVRHGIERLGWRVIQKTLPPSGLNDMATVDWKAVAEGLADAMQVLLQQEDLTDTAPAEQAGSAMDNYQIAVAEEALRVGPEIDIREDDDDG